MKLDEKTIEKKYIYKGRIINVRTDTAELPNGKQALREVVEHPGGVTVAALTDNDELMFVRQFRYPYSEVLLELPAGKLEYGEDPFEAGKRGGALYRPRKILSHPGLLRRDNPYVCGEGAVLHIPRPRRR